jgi:predicted protein tyrosine phosphatase
MSEQSFTLLTVCGLQELSGHSTRRVTHVLSILDPDLADPDAFGAYDSHRRTILRFHDEIEAGPGVVLPRPDHVEAVLAFGRDIDGDDVHLLVHCHAGISRSTAAMTMILAQAHPDEPETAIVERVASMRPQAWPNSRMIGYADRMLARDGRLVEAVSALYGRRLAEQPSLAPIMEALNRAREIDMARAAMARA